MDELSPAARMLMDRATAEDEPPEREIDESWGMVVSRVEAAGSPPRPRVVSVRAALVAALVVLLGLGAFVVLAPVRERVSVVRIPDVRSSRPEAEPRAAVRPVADTPGERDDAGLLDEAEAMLATDPARAWAPLLRHAEISSDGASVPRRLALRIRTLCALGRKNDAIHETTAFLSRHGDTPEAEVVRAACGARGAED